MANDCLKIPAFNLMAIDAHFGINCPQFYFEIGKEPFRHILGDVVDVTNFDVNLLHLRPGQGHPKAFGMPFHYSQMLK